MDPPKIQGYKIRAEIGAGSTGIVYEAQRDDGTLCAVKVFDSMSSNAKLLESRVTRVMETGAQDVTVPVVAQALDSLPSCLVMPLMAERFGDEVTQFRPRTLQTYFKDYQENEYSWPFILKFATRLATLHTNKVAHGNLKPGNIFLGANGGPLMADYATGLMPGVHRLGYSDALLYSPPEQLRYPEGYTEEAGYRWDAYAFGVIAYRVLTGVFPRCHEIFDSVCPAPGTQQRFSIEADREEIAEGLDESESFSWPTEPADDREEKRREMINFCLALDPMGRPSDMREVTRYFETIEVDLAGEEANRRLIAAGDLADKKRGKARRNFALASLIAAGLGGGWGYTQHLRMQENVSAAFEFKDYRGTLESRITDLGMQRDQALDAEGGALKKRDELQTTLDQEQSKTREELVSAQITNENLFDWLLEEGIEGLPVLEARQERLGLLLKKVEEQLTGMEVRPSLAKQAAVLRLRKAELVLAMGLLNQGEEFLNQAIEKGGLSGAQTARSRLRSLLLASKKDPSNLEDRVAESEAVILKAWGEDESKKLRATAALHLVKARMWEAKRDGKKALVSYLASLEDFKKLEEIHPDNPSIRLMVGHRYLTAALAAEGEGSPENSAKLRGEAAASFAALAEKQEHPSLELQYQIASANAAKAISLWQQGDTFGAEKLARQCFDKLSAIQAKMPDDFRVVNDLAAQQGIIATALRDEGQPTEAKSLLEKGIKSLEVGLEKDPDNWGARYLLASLKWQLSGLMGQQGESDEELKLGVAAYDELKALLETEMKRPHPSEVRKSLAYLCGDLGHSADLRNKHELAIGYLKESKKYWEELAREEGDKLEISEGFHWVVTRLAEMGVK
ncbi:MAG: protein kinase domain-containing protein [Verrucomicrobiales bacterium]|jgi:hypothetical protein